MSAPAGSLFQGVSTAALAGPVDAASFHAGEAARLLLAPPGRMALPAHRIPHLPDGHYRVGHYNFTGGDGRFPVELEFPGMQLTRLRDVVCPPFGPPVLPGPRQIVTDDLPFWEPDRIGWFAPAGGDGYRLTHALPDAGLPMIETALYLDHAFSCHWGHFLFDCLSRVHALKRARALCGDIKLVVAHDPAAGFQTALLAAAGVAAEDVVRARTPVLCRTLLLATPSVGLGRYASPTGARLWQALRDRVAVRNESFPDRVYLTRGGVGERRLANEAAVEDLFQRFGFAIVHPQALTVPAQITLAANARLIAGPSGSGLFAPLAFQARLRSAFVLVWKEFIQLAELLMAAGHEADLWFHLGERVSRGPDDPWGTWVADLPRLEQEVADWLRETDRR